ncbi:DoxX family protein [Paenibacillus azoreducens]|uniref:DoxX family protein n=1 Tax=Paenibacillus azoreducens TaxID=116718 RepID=A0A919YG84_9BACL|nr:DoxX family protein [Paenibacillus azoreducens]GIO48738.1 hypothetical protein J34TS1_35030 [Paenibacillus azoreducens]
MYYVLIIGQFILIAMFAFSAYMKFSRNKTMVHHWEEYRYPMWFMFATASLELLGVLGLITAFWIPGLLKAAALLLAVLMIGAVHAHLFRAKHKPAMAVNALVMLAIAVVLLCV